MNRMILSGSILINEKQEIYMLFRNGFFETPGGKVEKSECKDFAHPSVLELIKSSQRELYEEVKGIRKIIHTEYLAGVDFVTPKGVPATAHKTLRVVEGKLVPNEDIFDKEKSGFYPVEFLEVNPTTPDFEYFVPIIKDKLKQIYPF